MGGRALQAYREAAAQPGGALPRLSRREFFRFAGALASVPVAGVVADELLELLAPRSTILLPATAEGLWTINSLGGYFYSRQLSRVLRTALQPLVRFRQFDDSHLIAPVRETFTWDVYGDAPP